MWQRRGDSKLNKHLDIIFAEGKECRKKKKKGRDQFLSLFSFWGIFIMPFIVNK